MESKLNHGVGLAVVGHVKIKTQVLQALHEAGVILFQAVVQFLGEWSAVDIRVGAGVNELGFLCFLCSLLNCLVQEKPNLAAEVVGRGQNGFFRGIVFQFFLGRGNSCLQRVNNSASLLRCGCHFCFLLELGVKVLCLNSRASARNIRGLLITRKSRTKYIIT